MLTFINSIRETVEVSETESGVAPHSFSLILYRRQIFYTETFIMITCQICQREFKNLNVLSRHIYIHTEIISTKQYYDLYFLEDKNKKYCVFCGDDAKFMNLVHGYKVNCGGDTCRKKQTQQTNKERYKKICQERYGCDNAFQSEEVKQKSKETCLDKYNTEYASQSKSFKKSVTRTYKNKTQKEIDGITQKRIITFKNRYGCDNPSQVEEIQQKKIRTNLKLYGAENYSQNEDLYNNIKRYKPIHYFLPSGKIINLQGYEWVYLDEYFAEGFLEEDIIVHPKQDIIGKIWYYTENGKKHRYFPDFYIPKLNLIVEVKSTWTYKNSKDSSKLKNNILKQKACINKGYNFIFKIYGNIKKKYRKNK